MYKIASSFLLLFGIILIINFIITLSNLYPLDKEITLSNVQGIVLDNEKFIYIGIGPPTNRVQVYDSFGNFIENIKVDGGRHNYCFEIYKGVPIVTKYSVTKTKALRKLLQTRHSNKYLSPCDKQILYPHNMVNKGRYEINNGLFQTDLVKNHKKVIIHQGFFYKLLDINTVIVLLILTVISFIMLNLTIVLDHYMENGSLKIIRLFKHIFKCNSIK